MGRSWLLRLDLSAITEKAVFSNNLGRNKNISPLKYAANSEAEEQIIPQIPVRILGCVWDPVTMSRE